MPQKKKQINKKNPDFDAISLNPKISATIIKERLIDAGYAHTKINNKPGFGEIIAPHYEIIVNRDTVAFIYEPIACHSYNVLNIKGRKIKVATIDTMLSFYLAFLYADRPYYDHDRIYCMSQYLFSVQAKNRLQQKGVLKRFSLQCIGKQTTLEDMRTEKNKKFIELAMKKGDPEYDAWFLKYNPSNKGFLPNAYQANKHHKNKTYRKHKATRKNKANRKTKKHLFRFKW